ncbi:hypothetical protein BKA93DRAFT_829971 [Sparassis latifolia]
MSSNQSGDVSQSQRHPNEDASPGYRSIFAVDGSNSSVPRWLPLSLLALTTAALAVPAVMFWRQRGVALSRTLADPPPPPPPPRRTVSGGTILPRSTASGDAPPPRRTVALPPIVPQRASPSSSQSSTMQAGGPTLIPDAEDNFNGALYTMKAFGIATLLVTVGAGTAVWGIKTALGVRDTQEFADRVRMFIVKRMPVLSYRIYRPLGLEDEELDAKSVSTLSQPHPDDVLQWSWPDAEKRLKAAFERDGFMGWAEAAVTELEAEGQVERVRRGHIS